MSIEIKMRENGWRIKILEEQWEVPDKELLNLLKILVSYKKRYAIKNFKPTKGWKTMKNEIEIDGEKYVLASSVKDFKPPTTMKGKKYVIVRTYSAGVFAGYLDSRKGKEVVLLNARRIHYWDGSASLSQLAVDGTSKPENCRFPCEVSRVELTEAIEILDVTEKARKSIAGVPVWKK